jgi:hypothetical protein
MLVLVARVSRRSNTMELCQKKRETPWSSCNRDFELKMHWVAVGPCRQDVIGDDLARVATNTLKTMVRRGI